jgi:hypothetical protein
MVRADSVQAETRVASAEPTSGGGSGFFGNLFSSGARLVGIGKSNEAEKAAPTAPKAKPATKRPKAADDKKPAAKQATNAGAIRPKTETREANAAAQTSSGALSGSQPTVPAGGFENRFGAWR